MSKALITADDAPLRFEGLRLPVGETVRLECRAPQRRWALSYVGLLPEQALLVTLPSRGNQPVLLPEDTPVTLRFIAGNRACACTTRVQKSVLAPQPLLYLDYPRQLEAVKIRSATRLQTRLLVSVDGGDELQTAGSWPRQALCRDISLKGAQIESADLLGEVGGTLYVTARLPVGELDQVVLFEAKICNLEEVDSATEYCVRHGVEFQSLDEETRLVLTGFVYQQMLREQFAL
ncbi:flagellar brake protein [Motiliproteus sediminis]|uniref:flagellar brake protein n=1 Tax=Motiliproteus sediminis TaxID=1468178 RepID=UPI001AEFC4F6|nr:flagellar brake protein [Motiliproteus sediminis]